MTNPNFHYQQRHDVKVETKLDAWIDGACEPINPGGTASFGVIVKSNGVAIYTLSGIVSSGMTMSNNVGEYYALYRLLQWYIEWHNREGVSILMTVHSDSQLVVNQMKGRYKVRGGLYVPYYNKVAKIITDDIFKLLTFEWIPREQNWEADRLSKDALLAHGINITERD